jgi:hypothetical protein
VGDRQQVIVSREQDSLKLRGTVEDFEVRYSGSLVFLNRKHINVAESESDCDLAGNVFVHIERDAH